MRHRSLLVMTVVAVALAGCSKAKPSAGGSTPAPSTSGPSPRSTSNLPPYDPVIDPANFTDKITNLYFPLAPGTTYIFEGTRDGVPRRDEVSVTLETKVILGVPCLVVRDVVTSNAALVEKTTDWYAQDSAGNVWYFGEDTAEYTNGAVSSTAGTWLAGVDGALPGMVMEASPNVGDAYRQEYRPGVAEDFAKVQQLDATAPIPGGTASQVMVTEDTDLLDASKLEHKLYAPGIGFVGSSGMVGGHQEEVHLVSIQKPA